jgi:hypothetical protein
LEIADRVWAGWRNEMFAADGRLGHRNDQKNRSLTSASRLT